MEFAIDLDCQSSTKIQTEIVPFPGSPHETNQSEMKKSTSKASLVPAGGGVWVQKKSSRPVPNNKGLSYFK